MFRLARLDTNQFSIAPAPLSLVSPSQPSSGAWPAWESIFSWLFAFNLLCGPNNCLFFFKCNRRLVAATRSRNAGTQTTTWTSSPWGQSGSLRLGSAFSQPGGTPSDPRSASTPGALDALFLVFASRWARLTYKLLHLQGEIYCCPRRGSWALCLRLIWGHYSRRD